MPHFLLGAYEITQAQYEAVMGSNPSRFRAPSRPVEWVSWIGAARFCNRLSRYSSLDSCYVLRGGVWLCLYENNGYRMPTGMEWEYACRAGSSSRYCNGDSSADLERTAWFDKNSGKTTHPVGLKEPNAWGLYDMHGNVWEFCSDRWMDNYSPFRRYYPKGDGTVTPRPARGGSWMGEEVYCRSALRVVCYEDFKYYNLGFRVARTIK